VQDTEFEMVELGGGSARQHRKPLRPNNLALQPFQTPYKLHTILL